jgi:hypothetical protein
MARYNVYTGEFICHTCKDMVPTLRMYASLKEMTWMCKDGHLSKVSLNTKKSKEDYDRKIGE